MPLASSARGVRCPVPAYGVVCDVRYLHMCNVRYLHGAVCNVRYLQTWLGMRCAVLTKAICYQTAGRPPA
eukprot:2092249-Rhodomonas_salina.2